MSSEPPAATGGNGDGKARDGERPKRRRPKRRREEQPSGQAGAVVCAVIGGLLLSFGAMQLPRVLALFAEEDTAYVLGRLTVVAGECAIGFLLLTPLVKRHRSRQADRTREPDEDEGW
jgi:hypothetical protein